MTTTVKIDAHCAADKEVYVSIHEAGKTVETFTLQDGESTDRVVYDEREIRVRELPKE